MIMKLSSHSTHDAERINSFEQIAAHVGGMTRALVRHYPINWSFHWRGICRALSPEGLNASGEAKLNRAQVQ